MMKSKMKIRLLSPAMHLAVAMALLTGAVLAGAQAPSRFVGTITAISGNTLTVKTDADGERQVEVPSTATLKRIAPGEKDLSKAETIPFNDLAVGDRALVKLDPDAPAGTSEALQIVAVKKADLALKQQKDREDWQQRGVGGLVKSVDTASGIIVLTSGAGAAAKTITVHTIRTTMLKRYAPASVSFDAAQPAPINAIHAGDQLRARGAKNADGTEIAAEEVVSGSFRNISGIIGVLDASGSTLQVKDLATKKTVTIHITADAQMRRLPDRMAQMLAARLKGVNGGTSKNSQPANDNAVPAQPGARSGGAGGQASNTQWAAQNGGQGADPQQMLNRAPAIQLGDLKKGEAVMVVSTDGTTEVTAISLVAGVEPLLEAPAASQDLLSNWSMSASAPDAAQ
jgi:hypothetical protein